MTENRQDTQLKKEQILDYYTQAGNETINAENQTSNRINDLLVTASLAYMGIMLAALNDVEKISELSSCQKTILILNCIAFVLSIGLGVTGHLIDKKFFHEVSKKHREIVRELENVDSEDNFSRIQKEKISKLNSKECQESKKWPLVGQGIAFGVGLLLLIFYIFISLFCK